LPFLKYKPASKKTTNKENLDHSLPWKLKKEAEQ